MVVVLFVLSFVQGIAVDFNRTYTTVFLDRCIKSVSLEFIAEYKLVSVEI